MRGPLTTTAAALAGAVLILVADARTLVSAGGADVLTYHNDNERTGQNLNETFLSAATVNAAVFGKVATLSVDGKVDAQPLLLSGVPIPGQGTPESRSGWASTF